MKKHIAIASLVLLSSAAMLRSEELSASFQALNKQPFFLGREYFVLRSGRAELIVQADRADLGPALTYLLFDSQNASHSARKDRAFNFDPTAGFASSALVVELGGYPFTAYGHRTDTRWTLYQGIPAVEATWWAGGIRVTEIIAAVGDQGAFLRSIHLEGANIGGTDRVNLRLNLPADSTISGGNILVRSAKDHALAISAEPTSFKQEISENGLRIGPIPISPGASVDLNTWLCVQIPAGNVETMTTYTNTLISSSAKDELRATRKRWEETSTVTTTDKTIQEIFNKARFGLAAMIADDGTMNAGIFEYGAQWVRDTSNSVLGAIHAGHFELARSALQRILTKMVTREGVTMVGNNFDEPDREQFDQMGELLHVLKAYRDWTGDDSPIREHRDVLIAMIERPLRKQFRDETGMVHNRREFWERTLSDGYELAYQTYVIQGLRDATDLAASLNAQDRAARWKQEADQILKSMLSHPTRSLVQDGRLIKRRNISGEPAIHSEFPGLAPDTPAKTESTKLLMPDATQALPIAFGLVDARSDLSIRTLDELEKLWNARWSDGGYDRYHTSGQPDQPGPWPFATCFILRAQHEAGLYDRSRRSLEWLNTVQGGRTGAWFEEIPSIRFTQTISGIVPWTSAEIALFVVRHCLGIRFDGDRLVIKPSLYPDSPPVKADLRFRKSRLTLEIKGGGPIRKAIVNGEAIKTSDDGSIRLPNDFEGGNIVIEASR